MDLRLQISPFVRFLFDYPHFLSRLANDVHGAFDLAWFVRGSDRGAQAGKTFRDRG